MVMQRFSQAVIVILLAIGVGAGALAGCSAQQPGTSQQVAQQSQTELRLENVPILRDENFGGIYLDMTIDEFNESGFTFGDGVDITFSNGYELKGIPYYNGYYVNVGDPVLVGYPGYPHVQAALNNADPLWTVSGVSEGDTATVVLSGPGVFLSTQDAFDIAYSDERGDYDSDVEFANFRALTGGNMKAGAAYRSASPVDNVHNRAPYVNELMAQAGVAYVLDLSDNPAEVEECLAEDAADGVDVADFVRLHDAGLVGMPDLSSSYPTDKFARSLAASLVEMSQHDGPYLVHCVEGKDRTGFVCILLEALCGATYDEMLADYMITYDNYYGITRESDPEKFDAIYGLNFDGMMRYLAEADDGADLSAIDYAEPVRSYLRRGGMTDEQIDALVEKLTQ